MGKCLGKVIGLPQILKGGHILYAKDKDKEYVKAWNIIGRELNEKCKAN